MPINYIKGDLFTAPSNQALLHAVNRQGKWGAGIAREFARRFHAAHEAFAEEYFSGNSESFSYGYYNRKIFWLYTSKGFGRYKDPEDVILQNTHRAVADLLYDFPELTINSPKINSGLFAVPWEKTATIIKDALKWYPKVIWNVWEL